MKKQETTKKGLFGFLKEAFSKSAGCCGAGGDCGPTESNTPKAQAEQPAEQPPPQPKPPESGAKPNE
jgi:hypothetical protein